ncbi:hypothetical protein SAMN04488500_11463 [Sporomusa malonica]|uniref:Uncharacterized protein n=1 Tax=Sporomusa malonica TaxID=112901 RepID=A0A1W2D9I3_9FIRM|nr:hypothetical protein SAMN04488500_11463 [Sporomusa malonica]
MFILKSILFAFIIVSLTPIYLLYFGLTLAIIILEITTPPTTPPVNVSESEGMTIGFRLMEVLFTKPIFFVKQIYNQIF